MKARSPPINDRNRMNRPREEPNKNPKKENESTERGTHQEPDRKRMNQPEKERKQIPTERECINQRKQNKIPTERGT